MRRTTLTPKRCENCNGWMLRKTYSGRPELPCEYKIRRFCGHRCANEAAARINVHGKCRHCGSTLVRRRYASGTLEPASDFRRREHCDKECRDLWRDEHRVEHSQSIVRGLRQSVAYRNWLRELQRKRSRAAREPVCYHGKPNGDGCEPCAEIARLTGTSWGSMVKPREFWKRLTYQSKGSE